MSVVLWVVLFVIFSILAGIIIFSESPRTKKARLDHLKEMARLFEGKLEEIDGRENSYRVSFRFGDEDFVFEDYEEPGFREKTYRAFLRNQTASKVDISFTEQAWGKTIKSDLRLASQIDDQPVAREVKVKLPESLKGLNIHTNDPDQVNKLFEDARVERAFCDFKNSDERGYPFISLRVIGGTVILEFFAVSRYKPNLVSLYSDIPTLENYLQKMVPVIRRLNQIQPFLS